MATDIGKIISHLLDFHDLSNQTVISVGAGGGQFIEYGRSAKSVLAVDSDRKALDTLEQSLSRAGLSEKFTLIHSEFNACRLKGDVVMFEFCLHEIPDPGLALSHARGMAPRVLVADHWPDSEWVFFTDEKEKVERSWAEVNRLRPLKVKKYETRQIFTNYREIFDKVSGQGETAIQRIGVFKDRKDFSVPMSYGFALI